ncbi:hypothetical protein ACIQRW_24295 [Streptomyces sp. NPDC091287]|uniref:TetR/AcrR family transcriptional regulator n=1 Tax=Streptomyces sp. NPDC091287 TaxID=3365988 RepID=UPI003813A182
MRPSITVIEPLLLDGIASRSVDGATLRARIVSSMLVGLMVGRSVVGAPTLTGADRETFVALVGPAVQSVLVFAPSDQPSVLEPTRPTAGGVTSRVTPGGAADVDASVAAAERAFVSPSGRTTCVAPEPEQLQSPTGYESGYGVGLASGRAAQGGGRTDTSTSAPPACAACKKIA